MCPKWARASAMLAEIDASSEMSPVIGLKLSACGLEFGFLSCAVTLQPFA